MLWKRKRNIGPVAHPRYRYWADRVSECADVVIVNPDIAAHRVIEASEAVVSMPFTSTALIARDLGKPACYYDPGGLVQKDDRAAHGIEILTGPEELTAWFKNLSSSAFLSEEKMTTPGAERNL
jgi:polysaccharide biosynthesis PFTS motif protein